MKNHVIFNRTAKSRLNSFCIGEGAKLNLCGATFPLLHFTLQCYLDDPEIISGDVNKLKELVNCY